MLTVQWAKNPHAIDSNCQLILLCFLSNVMAIILNCLFNVILLQSFQSRKKGWTKQKLLNHSRENTNISYLVTPFVDNVDLWTESPCFGVFFIFCCCSCYTNILFIQIRWIDSNVFFSLPKKKQKQHFVLLWWCLMWSRHESTV